MNAASRSHRWQAHDSNDSGADDGCKLAVILRPLAPSGNRPPPFGFDVEREVCPPEAGETQRKSERLAGSPPPAEGLMPPEVEALITATGADVRTGGARAFYAPCRTPPCRPGRESDPGKAFHGVAPELTANNSSAGFVAPMSLKDLLGKIQTDSDDAHVDSHP